MTYKCQTKLCLVILGMQRKYIFTQASFYLQDIHNDFNEQDMFPDCKHKHMMKSRAPPEKFPALYCYLKYSMVSQAELISKV